MPAIVRVMVFAILGILIGLLIVLGPLSILSGGADAVANSMILFTENVFKYLIDLTGLQGDWSIALSVIIANFTPGFVALFLLLSGRVGLNTRRAGGVGIALLGVVSFAFVPEKEAFTLLIVGIVLGVLVLLLSGRALTVILSALATTLGGSYLIALWGSRGKDGVADTGAAQLSSITQVDQSIWLLALMLVGTFPFIAGILGVLGSGDSKKDKND